MLGGSEMSMFNNKAVTYDQLIDMIKAMRDANKIDSIHAEECLGGSLERDAMRFV
jgi:hypothetical protein